MNGLKVYLKSSITKAYHYAQGVCGILLIMNALREYERVEGQKLQLLFAVLAGLLLVLAMLIPRSMRRKARLLPGTLLILGGASLILLTRSSATIAYFKYNYLLEILGYLYCLAGVLQPFIDTVHVVYFTHEGIRHKAGFLTRFMKWEEVKGIVYGENGYNVELHSGKTIRMVPYDTNSQNLRVYIDKIRLESKSSSDSGMLHGQAPLPS